MGAALLLVAACCWAIGAAPLAAAAASAAPGRTAYLVGSMAERVVAANHSYARLADVLAPDVLAQYDVVALAEDYRIKPGEFPPDAPLTLGRNLTITSAAHAGDASGAPPPPRAAASADRFALLETEFAEGNLVLGPNVTLTARDLALGRARKTSGQGIPFFVGYGASSRLVLQDVVRVRSVCAPNVDDVVYTLLAAAAQDGGCANGSARPVAGLVTFTWRGVEHARSLHAYNVSSLVTPGDVSDTGGLYTGYTISQMNTTRVCQAYASAACVAARGAEPCVLQAVNELLAAEAAGAGGSSGGGVPVVAVVVPLVIGVLLATGVALALLLLRRRRRRRRKAAQAGQPLQPHGGDAHQVLLVRAGSAGAGGALESGDDDGLPSDPANVPGGVSGATGTIGELAVGKRKGSWKLVSCHTSPDFRDATPNDRIKLGVLLGAGSFGRVYKGIWHNMDVAVKVLQHDSSTSAAISNEVDLVMSFRHPNIVTALHFVTWVQTRPNQTNTPPSPVLGRMQQQQLQPMVMHNSRLMTVTECTTPSSRETTGSMAKPPGIVTRSGSAVAAGTPAGGAAGRAGSTGNGTDISSSSNVSAVLSGAAFGAAGGSGGLLLMRGNSATPPAAMAALPAGLGGSPAQELVVVPLGQQQVQQQVQQLGSGDTVSTMPLPPTPTRTEEGAGAADEAAADTAPGQGAPAAADTARSAPAPPPPLRAAVSSPLRSPFAAAAAALPRDRAASQTDSLRTAGSPDSDVYELHIIPFTPGQLYEHLQQQQQQLLALEPSSVQDAAAATTASPLSLRSSTAGGAAPSASAPPTSSSAAVTEEQQQHARRTSFDTVSGHAAAAAAAAAGRQGSSSAAQSAATDAARRPGGGATEAQTWLILEFCDGGTLLDMLQDSTQLQSVTTGSRRTAQVLTMLVDIAAGMSYLHARNVLHGDLKPGNVLIKYETGTPYGRTAKVADFGLARALQVGQSHRSTRTMGTMNHTPPELLRLGRLSPAGDVYAFGIIMWEVWTGQVAFSGMHYGEVFEKVALLQQRPPVPADMPAEYAALMQDCWVGDPQGRPSFSAVAARLAAMLAAVVQDQVDAHERFVADL